MVLSVLLSAMLSAMPLLPCFHLSANVTSRDTGPVVLSAMLSAMLSVVLSAIPISEGLAS